MYKWDKRVRGEATLALDEVAVYYGYIRGVIIGYYRGYKDKMNRMEYYEVGICVSGITLRGKIYIL